jgi:hypothetical protein
VWAIAWRPLVRAERANLTAAGLGPPPPRKEPSHWVVAWLIAWPIAMVLGAVARAVRVPPGPAGVVIWVGLLWAIKRGLDSRESV